MGWNLSGLTGSLEAKLHGQEVEGTAEWTADQGGQKSGREGLRPQPWG